MIILLVYGRQPTCRKLAPQVSIFGPDTQVFPFLWPEFVAVREYIGGLRGMCGCFLLCGVACLRGREMVRVFCLGVWADGDVAGLPGLTNNNFFGVRT